jgi:hypothetical protein
LAEEVAVTEAELIERIRSRLAEDPEHVGPVLRLIADPDATPAREQVSDEALRMNAQRIAEQQHRFRDRAYPGDRVRQMLGGITRQALSRKVTGGRLIALRLGNTSWFPDWQFGPDGTAVPHLPRLLAALPASPLAADRAMRAALPEEGGRSPADLLAEGHADLAVHYAASAGSER